MVGLINDDTTAENWLERAAFKVARTVRGALGTGIGRADEDSATAYVTAKPHAVFSQLMLQQQFAFIDGWTSAFEDMIERAAKHFKDNPKAANHPTFRFTSKELGYGRGLFSDGRAFEYLYTALARYGMDLETMARELNAKRVEDAGTPVLTDDQFRRLAAVTQNEITLDSNPASRPSAMFTNPIIRAAAPLVSWSVSKAHDLWENSRRANMTAHGSYGKAIGAVMLPYLALVPIALAMAWFRDKYDEELLNKKANRAAPGSFYGMVDALARVGTFGVWGDVGNSIVNRDTERPFSVDNRIFFMSSLLNAKRAMQNWTSEMIGWSNGRKSQTPGARPALWLEAVHRLWASPLILVLE